MAKQNEISAVRRRRLTELGRMMGQEGRWVVEPLGGQRRPCSGVRGGCWRKVPANAAREALCRWERLEA